METAHRYRASAEEAARGASPRYEEFALGVAEDRDVLAFPSTLPELKRQPNLLFAAVKYLAGVPPDYGAFHDFVIGHMDELRQLMRTRSTQTNEPGRCAVLLPLLASLRQPIALLEVGAAAGLCLLCDRYGYDHEGHRVGPADAPVVFPCNPIGSVPLPERVPRVVWRCGVDLDPLDVTDPDTAAWLTALVWADNTDREERLQAALRIATVDAPPVLAGDILGTIEPLAESAPADATLVLFHSAVMPYLRPQDRTRFVERISSLSTVWVSFEGRGVLPEIDARLPTSASDEDAFVLARDGEPLALADPHGCWLRWLERP
ncbi:MAG: DUF2332 domain-containing protein [Actinobacteria bacterium]|nr:MAG: DUF2332 domain-containing protein [Actinomycetota bacterium]